MPSHSGRSTPLPPSPATKRFESGRQDYQTHLKTIEALQSELRHEAVDLAKQHSWDDETQGAIDDWLSDKNIVFRALRRNRFDRDKTHAFLLAVMPRRAERKLWQPIPSMPYADSDLFYVLPLPQFTDRLGRPVAVLNVRSIVRNDSGLDELKEWSWWAVEWVRRVMDEWWTQTSIREVGGAQPKQPRGQGGEGMTVIVNAKGGGYRNLEVELLPILMHIGHDNSPGMVENVYVVNLSSMQSYLWAVVKRVLPTVALEKIGFLENEKQLAEVFDLDRLPKELGGTADFTFTPGNNPMLKRYQSSSPPSFSRSSSATSTSHSFRTAPSVDPSRPPSRQASGSSSGPNGLQMTAASDSANDARSDKGKDNGEEVDAAGSLDAGVKRSKSLTTNLARLDAHTMSTGIPSPLNSLSHVNTTYHMIDGTFSSASASMSSAASHSQSRSSTSPPRRHSRSRHTSAASSRRSSIGHASHSISRIKSLTDFHLYLSPSRLAHIDLLNDSDPEDEGALAVPEVHPKSQLHLPADPPQRKKLLPAMLQHVKSPDKVARPPLRVLGMAGKLGEAEQVRTYSGRLQRHHAEVLQSYRDKGDIVSPMLLPSHTASSAATDEDVDAANVPSPNSSAAFDDSTAFPPGGDDHLLTPTPTLIADPLTSDLPHTDVPRSPPSTEARLALYSRSNPFFGYPTVLSSDGSIVPIHYRRRKRDLVKTLLFLVMLRLQSLRFWLERLLGLHHLSRLRSFRDVGDAGDARTPAEGLTRQRDERALRRRNKTHAGDREWFWTLVGVLLLRGAWTSWLDGPLRLLGLETAREILGLV